MPEGIRSKELVCPAKINLFLKVGPRRADGYHEVFTLMQPVSLYDRVVVTVASGSGIEVVCGDPRVPSGRDNIVWTAAERFLKASGRESKVVIDVEKKIPLGAGLGGGSSDAAGVLMALNELFSFPLSHRELTSVAAECGSDVPFFLVRGAAIARGRGERVEKIELPEYYYILVNPGFTLSTAKVYHTFDLTERAKSNILNSFQVSIKDKADLLRYMENDLEEAVLESYPEVGYLKDVLKEAGAEAALMSGSGPTVFGLFFDKEKAEAARRAVIETVPPSMKVFSVRGL